MNMWAEAADDLAKAIDEIPGELTGDQLLQVALIKALLSISQELSGIHHNGINSEYLVGE